MTEREAEIEMFNLLTEENGAMIPVGHVNQLIHRIYKEFEKEKQEIEKKFQNSLKNIDKLSNL
jgi:hypothetical protein